MDASSPLELGQLLHGADTAVREAAWDTLISAHSRIILAVARTFGGDRDAAMERYTYVVEKLRENDFRRLRAYRSAGSARFSTWLNVTARHLCLDYHRARYGRVSGREDSDASAAARLERRRLEDSIAAELDLDLLPDNLAIPPDVESHHATRDQFLSEAVARLSAADQLLLSLRFREGLSASQIGAIVGMATPFHVYRRLNYLLRQLRGDLQSRGIDGVDG